MAMVARVRTARRGAAMTLGLVSWWLPCVAAGLLACGADAGGSGGEGGGGDDRDGGGAGNGQVGWSGPGGAGGGPGPGGTTDAGPEPDALPLDVTPPDIFFRSPFDGATVSGVVEVVAEATDDRGVTQVVFALDGAELATVSAVPFTWSWDTAGLIAGPYTLSATATDAAGNSDTALVNVQVAGACREPRCNGRQCGDDGCGGSCGVCAGGLVCDANGQCAAAPPVPQGFVRIEAGVFTMGSPVNEAGRGKDETRHQVTLTRAFALKATEVTQGEWFAVMGTRPSRFAGCGDDCPVEQVSWYDAVAYCNALSLSEGLPRCYADGGGADYDAADANNQTTPTWRNGLDCQGYRLPTEAEWEYAARAGTVEASYNGPVGEVDCGFDASLDPIAWHCGNSGDTAHPVGRKRANPWGLYDMLGNVWEWSWDWYAGYPAGAAQDPQGPAAGGDRVLRGGSWYNNGQSVRAASRPGNLPGNRYDNLGFRPARSLSFGPWALEPWDP
jgi:formylglycine-generating enzyme required for sulfatase activity